MGMACLLFISAELARSRRPGCGEEEDLNAESGTRMIHPRGVESALCYEECFLHVALGHDLQ